MAGKNKKQRKVQTPARLCALRGACLLLPIIPLTCTSFPAHAYTNWDGGAGTNNWFDANNWSGNALPTAADLTEVLNSSVFLTSPSAVTALFRTEGATFTISNGGQLTSLQGRVAQHTGPVGNMLITGTNSRWTTGWLAIGEETSTTGYLTVQDNGALIGTSSIQIGYSGNGTLNIQNGADVSNTFTQFGTYAGSSGTATVTGAGSTWTNSSDLNIGISGFGTLNIQNAATVSNTTGYLGNNAGASGTATVTGAGSTWTNSGGLRVGNSGTGTLNIQNGATVTNTTGYIGTSAESTGTATVTGAGSIWTNSSELRVGGSGTGTLSIQNGAAVTNTTGYIGTSAGSSGTATVSGVGSTWTNSSELRVGNAGTGTLNIQNGSAVSNTSGYIGSNTGSTGTAVVSGAGSTWMNSGNLSVGSNGTGHLTISDGGVVSNVIGYVGANAGSSGSTALITGAGSRWINSNNFIIGNNTTATGSLTLSNGGFLSSVQGILGNNVGSSGTATITDAGSSWVNSNSLVVGSSGAGTFNIQNGATVSNTAGYIGSNSGSSGTVMITGLGSSWTSTDKTHIGDSGTGTLNIFDSAHVFTQKSARIGNGLGSHGDVSVNGTGSRWEITEYLRVAAGWNGACTGSLTISDGGFVSNTYAHIGDASNTVGMVAVTGTGSTWSNSVNIIVGYSGAGTLNIQNGGSVSNTSVQIGREANSTGTATVTGAGSTWTSSGSLAVGNSGTGTLTVSDSGSVSTTALTIAANAGSVGTLNIGAAEGAAAVAAGRVQTPTVTFGAGTGTLVLNHTNGCGTDGLLCAGATGSAQAYDFTAALSGAGTIKALSGVTAMTGNLSGFTGSLSVSDAARLDVLGAYGGSASIASGGVLSANNNLTGPVAVNDGGTLKGSGSIGATSIASGGTLAPGNSIGTISIVGNVSFAVGSFYDVEIDAAGNSDLTTATGNATINGGTVTLIPEAGGLYRSGTTYTILHADGGVAGTFDAITLSSASLFLTATLSYDADDVFASLARNGTSFASTAVSFNEQQAAAALDQSGSANDAFNAVTALSSSAAARDAFALLSGELHADIKADLSQTRTEANALLLARMDNAAPDGKNLWAAPLTSARKLHGEGGQTSPFAATTNGVFFGVDAPQNDGSRLGLAFGFARTDYKLDARGGTASGANADHYHLASYHVRQAGPLRLNFAAAYDGHQIESARRLTIGGTSTAPTASYQAHGFGGMVDAAYPIVQTGLYSLEAHGGIEHALLYISDFQETGGSGALSASDDLSNAGATTIGLKATQTLALTQTSGPVATLSLGLDWRRALASSRTQGLYAFAGSDSFASEAAPAPRDAIILSGGAQMRLSPDVSLNLDALSSFNDAGSAFSARSSLSFRF